MENKEEPLGVKYGRWLSQFMRIPDGETIPWEWWLDLVEGGDFHTDVPVVTDLPVLDDKTMQELTQKALIEPIRNGEGVYGFQCFIPTEVMETIPEWPPWGMAHAYLKTQFIEPFVMFRNSKISIDGLEGYKAEIRFIPTMTNYVMGE